MGVPAGSRLLRSMVVIGLLLGAVGCDGDSAEPGRVGTPSPTTQTSSPSPTETPVEQQVEAAVRAYYAELTHAAQTLNTGRLKTLTSAACPCAGSADAIDRTRKDQRRIPDARWTLDRVKVHDVIARSAGAEVWYTVSAYQVLNKNNRVVNKFPKRSKHVDLSLILRQGEGWVLSNVFDLGG